MHPNLSQIPPEASSAPEEQGQDYYSATQGHTPGRAAQTARGPGSIQARGARTGDDGPVQIRISHYITGDYVHTRWRTAWWKKVSSNLPAETELSRE